MQHIRHINLDTFIIVSFGIKDTDLFITDHGLLNKKKGVLYNRVFNSGSYGYFINRKFRAESKLQKYPITFIIPIIAHIPF